VLWLLNEKYATAHDARFPYTYSERKKGAIKKSDGKTQRLHNLLKKETFAANVQSPYANTVSFWGFKSKGDGTRIADLFITHI
jgi:hypothetical protein